MLKFFTPRIAMIFLGIAALVSLPAALPAQDTKAEAKAAKAEAPKDEKPAKAPKKEKPAKPE